MHFSHFKVMIDSADHYVLTAMMTDSSGRRGFWFSDYRCESVAEALRSPDRPSGET
jgi:hypothetical protein